MGRTEGLRGEGERKIIAEQRKREKWIARGEIAEWNRGGGQE